MNLKELCKQKGTNISKLAEQTGIAPSTLYAISSGDTTLDKVGVSVFITISGALGYTTDELFSLLSGEPETPQLSTLEQQVVDMLRDMNTTGQNQLLEYARFMVEAHPKNTTVRGHSQSA